MKTEQLDQLKTWFATYTQSFLTGDTALDGPLILKIDHTHRVRENIRILGRSIALTDTKMRTAESIGLLHDVGRFAQYRQYGTFNDQKSANHGALGIRIIKDVGLLDAFHQDVQSTILAAIRYHNAPALPPRLPAAATVFMRLIRDADKLDIWKVFADYYRSHDEPEAAIVQHLVDTPRCAEAIVDALFEKRVAKFQDMKSINDFRLLQLSWVFDLNFPESFSQAKRRGDLAVIAGALPEDQRLANAIANVMDRLAQDGEDTTN